MKQIYENGMEGMRIEEVTQEMIGQTEKRIKVEMK